VLEKDGEGQLDQSCEKRSIKGQEGEDILKTVKRRKANWIGHILRRNCLLRHVIERNMQRIEVTTRRGGRRKNLLDDLNEKRGYCKLKEEALDRTVRITRFGRGCGPVVRQTTKKSLRMNF
jgi:hypothetical protein